MSMASDQGPPQGQGRAGPDGSTGLGDPPTAGAGPAPGQRADATDGEGAPNEAISVRALLAAYDHELETTLREVFRSDSGSERVRLLHQARRVMAVHDAVLQHALCPLLRDLPGGAPVAQRLCTGVEERAVLLHRFERLTRGVAPHNVYPASGEEVEEILAALDRSMRTHVDEETHDVGTVLEAAADSVDPDVVAARMALVAQRAPTRAHGGGGRRPRQWSMTAHRLRDRWADWNDAHHGWLDPRQHRATPRGAQADELKRRAGTGQPSVRDVLSGYDATIDTLVAEWRTASGPRARLDAAHRLAAAVTVHDSVLGGVLCPLLASLPDAGPAAKELRRGCDERAELLQSWSSLARSIQDPGADREAVRSLDELTGRLVASFDAHEHQETTEVSALLELLSDTDYRTRTSALADVAWPWHSEGPAVLALRMALWAETSPTRSHRLLVRHPTSRTLRRLFHSIDQWQDFWADTSLQRWLAPQASSAPYQDMQDIVPSGPSTSGPSTSGPSTSGPSTSGPSTSGPSTSGPSTSAPPMSDPSTTAAPGSDGPASTGPGSLTAERSSSEATGGHGAAPGIDPPSDDPPGSQG